MVTGNGEKLSWIAFANSLDRLDHSLSTRCHDLRGVRGIAFSTAAAVTRGSIGWASMPLKAHRFTNLPRLALASSPSLTGR